MDISCVFSSARNSMKRFLFGLFALGFLVALIASFSPRGQTIWIVWRGFDFVDVLIKLSVAAVLAWWLPARRDRIDYWSFSFLSGLLIGSVGLFPLKGLHIAGVAQWPFRFLGTAIPDLGSVFWHTSRLNPLFASCLIPIGLMALLGSHAVLKWMALGVSVGMTAFMLVAAVSSPSVVWFGSGFWAAIYLLVNAAICAISARLFFSAATES